MVHFGYVAFVVLGLGVVWVGYFRRWGWVRNVYFRVTHLLAMGIVVAEALLGIVCPLTVWELELRTLAGQEAAIDSFVARWVHRVLFFEADEAVFTVGYSLFFVALVLSFIFVRPTLKRGKPGRGNSDS